MATALLPAPPSGGRCWQLQNHLESARSLSTCFGHVLGRDPLSTVCREVPWCPVSWIGPAHLI